MATKKKTTEATTEETKTETKTESDARGVGGETKFQDPSVYKRQVMAGPEADAADEHLTLNIHISIWEVQNEDSIAGRWQRLETQELQIRSTMDQLEANGAKAGDDYAQLTVKHNEIIRQMEHMRKTIQPGSVVMLGKVQGVVGVKPGMDWNQCLDRHLIIENGKVTRILWKNPI
jgi:hypothetical protein